MTIKNLKNLNPYQKMIRDIILQNPNVKYLRSIDGEEIIINLGNKELIIELKILLYKLNDTFQICVEINEGNGKLIGIPFFSSNKKAKGLYTILGKLTFNNEIIIDHITNEIYRFLKMLIYNHGLNINFCDKSIQQLYMQE